MALEDRRPQFRQPLSGSCSPQIGTRNGVTEVQQDLRDPAHPDSANANEMNPLGLYEHGGFYFSRRALMSSASSQACVRPWTNQRNFLCHLMFISVDFRMSANHSGVTSGFASIAR